jgi:DNA-binding transcriptional regulator YiaG
MVEQAPTSKVALSVASFSNTPISAIRRAVGLSQAEVKDAVPTELAA